MVSPSAGSVTNTGVVKAASAYLTSAGGNVYALSGNTEGIIEATGSKTVNGQIWLTAPQGTVSVNSKLYSDGSITIFGNNTLVGPSSLVSVSGNGTIDVGLDTTKSLNTDISSGASFSTGDNGLLDTSGENLSIGNINVYVPNGQWLLDPTDFTVDSSNNSAIDTALGSGTVKIATTASGVSAFAFATSSSIPNGSYNSGNGDINIDAPLSWSSANTLALYAYDSINVDARITISGGGGLVLKYNTGNLPTPGTGTLNFPLTPTGFTGSVQFTGNTNSSGASTAAPSGSLTINGTGYTLVNDYNIESINSTGNYALATNITAPSSSFAPIGETTAFTGAFNGLGNTVSNLNIGSSSTPSTDTYAGLFGQVGSGGTLENVGVTNVKIYDSGTTGYVGGLAGYSQGAVSSSYATGSVSGSGSNTVGGLVGYNSYNTTVSSSYATGSVSGSGSNAVGGLVGKNASSGSVSYSYATGSVSGSVTAATVGSIGGLVGANGGGTVKNSYATGNVSGNSSGSFAGCFVGGLVGKNASSGSVSYSYATGSVSGSGSNIDIGGLVGANGGSTVKNSYWNTTSSGTSTGIGAGTTTGATGLSSSAMEQYTNFSGFNIYDPDTGTGSSTGNSGSSVWIQYNGYSLPLLRVFMNTLTVTANNSTTYNGSAYITAPSATYSPSTYNASEVLGTLSYLDDATNSAPVNAGTYGLLPGLYSTQNGYIIIYNGTLTIKQAALKQATFPDVFQAIYNQTGYSGKAAIVYDALSSYYASGGTTGGINALLPYTGLPHTGRIINDTHSNISFFGTAKKKKGRR
jgi:hypothetical protein